MTDNSLKKSNIANDNNKFISNFLSIDLHDLNQAMWYLINSICLYALFYLMIYETNIFNVYSFKF